MAKPGKIHTLDYKACQLVSCSYCSQNLCSLPNHLTGKYLNIYMYNVHVCVCNVFGEHGKRKELIKAQQRTIPNLAS